MPRPPHASNARCSLFNRTYATDFVSQDREEELKNAQMNTRPCLTLSMPTKRKETMREKKEEKPAACLF